MNNNIEWMASFEDEMDRNNNTFAMENKYVQDYLHMVEDSDMDSDFDSELLINSGSRHGDQQRRRGFRQSSIYLTIFCFFLLMHITFAKNLDDNRFGNMGSFNPDPMNDENLFETPHLYEPKFKRDSNHHIHESHQQRNHHFNHDTNQHHHLRRSQRDSAYKECKNVEFYFETKQIQMRGENEEKGPICGGNCCSNSTEVELRQKATLAFEDSLHHHTASLRSTLKATSELFENHILEISKQSKTHSLRIFSTVFRMVPLSKQLITTLYSDIINFLKIKNFGKYEKIDLEKNINNFFVDLFPVAYHHAVHISKNRTGELHEDYINCLKHAYEDLRPFDDIPKEIKHNLVQSVQTANIFMNSLLQSSEVLGEIDQLYGLFFTEKCKDHLLKMNDCQSCNGYPKKQAKPCHSYCMNVLRGCSAQYVGVLDSPWSNVADAIANLDQYIQSESGIVTVINKLSNKLSDTIMNALANGPDLEKKVTKKCGTPKLLPARNIEPESRPMQLQSSKLIPLDAGLLSYLSTIHKSKEFYSNIVTASCEADRSETRDKDCWTGDRIGEYTQLVMHTGLDTQRYNPEVPFEHNSQSIKLNEMADKLLKIKNNIGTALPQQNKRHYSDIQSDMARHDEEGSGRISDDVDDEELDGLHGSGDGSGGGPTPPPFDIPGYTTNTVQNTVQNRSGAGFTQPMHLSAFISIILLVTIKFSLA